MMPDPNLKAAKALNNATADEKVLLLKALNIYNSDDATEAEVMQALDDIFDVSRAQRKRLTGR